MVSYRTIHHYSNAYAKRSATLRESKENHSRRHLPSPSDGLPARERVASGKRLKGENGKIECEAGQTVAGCFGDSVVGAAGGRSGLHRAG